MDDRRQLLLGKIALREKLLTRVQLFDCLMAQERNPGRRLGEIMVHRGYLAKEKVRELLGLQEEALREASHERDLLGQILIRENLATRFQVHSSLRLQARMEELAIRPVPPLGQILLRRGYITRPALEAALQRQDVILYSCPGCIAPLPLDQPSATKCASCGAQLPPIFVQIARSALAGLERVSSEEEIEFPPEVAQAAKDPKNHFGRYLLLSEIGRGGAGLVHKAWERDQNRIVALKQLARSSETGAGIKTPLGDAEDVKRFWGEARAVTELNVEHIIPLYDYGTIDETPYYTMGYIDGETLDDMVRYGLDEKGRPLPPRGSGQPGHRIPLDRALGWLIRIARAVHQAHQKGIVHRDIKPSNLMIDRDGRPWIMDFGLAKILRIGDAAYVKGVVMGTPYYMPPEQASGDMEKVDHLSDVYSLGAVLYEAATGHSPFDGRSPDTVIDLLGREDPKWALELCPDLPADLDLVVRKAMHRDKGKRYPTAADLADDLERVQLGQPLAAEPRGARKVPTMRRLLGFFKRE